MLALNARYTTLFLVLACAAETGGGGDGTTGSGTGGGPMATDTATSSASSCGDCTHLDGTSDPIRLPADTGDGTATVAGSGTDTVADTDSGTSTGSGSGTETGDEPPDFDCATAPVTPVSVDLIEGARGYHGLVITPDGLMIGSDGVSLVASSYDGDAALFVPGMGLGQQMDWLPSGDFAWSTDARALERVGLDATTTVIRPSLNAYAVVVGPDGMIYVNTGLGAGRLARVDPSSGDLTPLFDGVVDAQAHSIGFSPSWGRMYVGTGSFSSGAVYYVDLDEAMNPTTDLLTLTTDANNGETPNGYYDGVAVDACGTVYVTDYWSSSIYRIEADGATTLYWQPESSSLYGHGLVWGTGSDGWKADALYLPQPYNANSVTEIVVGVPSREFGGVVRNATPEVGSRATKSWCDVHDCSPRRGAR